MPKFQHKDGKQTVVQRSLQILGEVAKSSVSDYVSPVTELKQDADELFKALNAGKSTSRETFNDLRRNGMKKFVDWFYGDGMMGDSSLEDEADSDFDASSLLSDIDDGGDNEPKATVLSEDSMKDIARGHVNAMTKVMGKQVEASVMSTAELITAIKHESSMITSALNTGNQHLMGIEQKLDAMLKLQQMGLQQQAELTETQQGLVDDNGRITLKTLTQSITNAINDSPIGMVAGLVKDKLGPAELISSVIDMTGIKDKKFSLFGDQSFNELGDQIQRTLSNSISGVFDKVLDSKLAQKIDEWTGVNLRNNDGNIDYRVHGKNQYTKDKAVFDNMTRESIIHVIPEYLRMITGALTGQNYHVTEHGKLSSEPQKDLFAEQLKRTTMSFSTDDISKISDNQIFNKLQTIDVNLDRGAYGKIKKWIVIAAAQYQYRTGVSRLSPNVVKSPQFSEYIKSSIINTLQYSGNTDNIAYWENLIDSFMFTIIADDQKITEFITAASGNISRQVKSNTTYAQNTHQTETLRDINLGDDAATGGNELLRIVMAEQESESEKLRRELTEEMEKRIDEATDNGASKKKLDRMRAEGEKKIDQELRKYENAGRVGDTDADMSKVLEDANKSLIGKMGIANEEFQNDVTATLHAILDVLNVGFGDKLMAPVQPAIQPKSRKVQVKSTVRPKPQPGPAPQAPLKPDQPVPPPPQQTQPAQQGTGIGGNPLEMTGVTEITAAVSDLKDVVMVGNVMSMANEDGNMSEDNQVVTQTINGMGDKGQATKTRNIFQKLAKTAGEKAKEIKEQPKSLISMLMGGASKLLAPITMLLKPLTTMVTKIFKPALTLIKRNLQSGVKSIKEGWSDVKSGLADATGVAGGKLGKAKDAIKDKIGGIKKKLGFKDSDEETIEDGISKPKTDAEGEADDIASEIKKGNEQAKQSEENAESRHNVIKDLLTRIQERLEKGIKQEKEPTEKGSTSVKDGPESGIGNGDQKKQDGKSQTPYKMDFAQNGPGQTFTASSGQIYTTSDQSSSLSDAGLSNASMGDTGGTMQEGMTDAGSVGDGLAQGASGKSMGKGLSGILKAVKGIGKMVGGIAKVVVTLVMSLTAVQTALSLVTKIVKKAIKPLNKAVKFLTSTLKPLIKKLGGVIEKIANVVVSLIDGLGKLLKPIVEVVSKVLDAVMDLLAPVLDAVSGVVSKVADTLGNIFSFLVPVVERLTPLFETLGDALGEILTTVGDLVTNILDPLWTALEPLISVVIDLSLEIMTPFFTIFKTVLVPLIKIISGVVQVGLGTVMSSLGLLTQGVGELIKLLGDIGGFGSKISESGKSMVTGGTNMVSKGIDIGIEGFKGLLGMDTTKKEEKQVTTDNNVTLPSKVASSGMSLDGTATNSIYGSGDQASYGSYLNMSKRGCGPIALAEAASARTGRYVDPRSLAGSMAASGNYSTSRGTSVAGFINQAAGMGLGYTAGGVTANSLRGASPSNPITVVGSGNGFGTKNGNMHYVNVIGTRGNIAYTSNPMSGRVERRTVSELTSRGLLGLYGSGDSGMGVDLQDLFSTLAEKAGGLLNIFNFEDTNSVADQQRKLELEEKVKQLTSSLGSEKMAAIESEAFKQWSAKHGQKKGESAQSYLARWNKVKNELIVEAAQKYADESTSDFFGTLGDTVADAVTNIFGIFDAESGTWSGGYADLSTQLFEALGMDAAEMGAGQSAFGSSSGGYGNGGSVLGMIPAVVKAYEAVGVVGKSGDYNQSGKTHTLTINGQTFKERPDCTGLCDSVIDAMGYDSEGRNSCRFQEAKGIKDRSGNISPDWQIIDKPAIESLQGGDIAIIYNGSAHHGEIVSGVDSGKVYGFSYGWEGGMARALAAVNDMLNNGTDAFTATKNNKGQINGHKYYTRAIRYVGAGANTGATGVDGLATTGVGTTGVGTTGGGTASAIDMSNLAPYYNNTWSHYKDKSGIREYFAAAQQAGMSPAQQALIMATGIWEDNAKKLTGQKSLTHVTQDVNGQRAFGIMNWIPKGGGSESYEYGKTLSEQLNYISRAYFGASPERRQGRVTQNVNSYAAALAQLAGHPVQGKEGDPIGPIIDRDLIEGSGHYVGGALVPAGWNTPKGLGKYIGTAVDVYNWMIENGLATGQAGGGSFGGSGNGIYGTIGSRVQQLLNTGTLNASGNSALGAAINLAISRGTPMSSALTAMTQFALSDTGQEIIGTALDTAGSVVNTAASGMKDLVSNRVTTAGKLVSTWWNGVKNTGSQLVGGVTGAADAISNVSEAGILQTLKDVGSSLYGGATGAVGSVFDTAGQEFQALYDGASNEVSIIKGTAEEVGSQIAEAVSQIASSVIGTERFGDATKGSKLQNMLKGNYGTVAYINPGSEALLQAYNAKQAVSMGWGLGQQQQSSVSDYGMYDDGGSDEEAGITIAPLADNSDMSSAYEQAVDARTKARWKKTFDDHRSEWSAKTRNGKNPTGWWDAYITNKRMADYYRLEYPGHVVNEAFSKWYASKFGATKSKTTTTGNITSARLLAQKLAYMNDVNDMVQMLYQYPQYATDAQVKKEFTRWGYDSYYTNALKNVKVQNWNTSNELLNTGTAATIQKIKYYSGVAGSGDEPSVAVVPPINEFALQQQLMDMNQPVEQTPTVVNQYLVGQNTTDNDGWIDRLNQITFNVRAERVEELLEEISEKLDSINTGGTTVITQPTKPDDSTYHIPEGVTKLARG